MFDRFAAAGVALCRGELPLQRLIEVKEAGKVAQSATSPDDRRGGTLDYFLAVASALAHHQTLISSRDRKDVNLVLIELATVLPEPWADLMCAAVESPDS